MDNAQIVSELKSRMVGQNGLSDQTITTLITPLIPSEGDPDEKFYETTANWLKSLSGNYSHDVASQVTTQLDAKTNEKLEAFKANWKPQNIDELYKVLGIQAAADSPKTLEDLQKMLSAKETPAVPQNKGVTMEDVAKLIEESQKKSNPLIEQLTKQIEEMKLEKEQMKSQAEFDTIIKSVTDKADELKISDTPLWETSISFVSATIDRKGLTEEKMLEAAKAKFVELTKALRPAGTKAFGDSTSNTGKSVLQQILDDKKSKSDAKRAAIEAQRKMWK